jgi:hypothetical protein
MTDVFELNVGEDTTINAYDNFTSYQLAEVMIDAMNIVKHYQSDLFHDAFKIADAMREVNDMPYGQHPKYVWALRTTGTDFVTPDTWAAFEQYPERSKVAFILTFGEYGINFKRIK